jgi:hypothetical protein
MRNLLMLLVAVLGTSVMVHAFPAKATSAKEITMKKHHKHDKAKKEQKVAATAPATKEKK